MRTFGGPFLIVILFLGVSAMAAAESSVAGEAGKTEVSLSTSLSPLTTGFRWEDNVYRLTGAERRSDGIESLGTGGAVVTDLRATWRAEVLYAFFADFYQTHSDLNNFRNQFQLSLTTLSEPVRGTFEKRFMIRRSPESNYDYWDDQIGLGLVWVPSSRWDAGLNYESATRRYYNGWAVIRARDYDDDTLSLDLVRHVEEHLAVQAGVTGGRRGFNRYAVGRIGETFVLQGGTQKDDTIGGRLGLRWHSASVLNEVILQFLRTSSNNYGSSYRARSVSWAAGMNLLPSWTLQMLGRLYHKSYDLDPLTLPEFQLGFNEEDGQDLLSAKSVWEFLPRWDLAMGVTRLRAESAIPGKFYIKQIMSIQLLRRF